jgi:hypothetical protein
LSVAAFLYWNLRENRGTPAVKPERIISTGRIGYRNSGANLLDYDQSDRARVREF